MYKPSKITAQMIRDELKSRRIPAHVATGRDAFRITLARHSLPVAAEAADVLSERFQLRGPTGAKIHADSFNTNGERSSALAYPTA